MRAQDSPARSVRRDGWTAERQLAFLDTLARTRSVTRAAEAAGMSRESAHRLRARDPNGLFAAAWDRALEGHGLVNFARPALGATRTARAAPHSQPRDL